MLNGLDLFSGIGGLSIALKEWVRPIAYCEIDPYCQAVLLQHMVANRLSNAPIATDIRELGANAFPRNIIDIIYGGFPCQDISVAGRGKGLEGERSGLFFEIVRLAKEIKPSFIFLENVPAITSRGGLRVVREIAEMGYDCRWCVISAASIGALHRRERWFLLAHTKHFRPYGIEERGSAEKTVHNDTKGQNETEQSKRGDQPRVLATKFTSYTTRQDRERLPERTESQRSIMGCLSSDGVRTEISNSTSLRCNEGPSEGIHSERPSEQSAQPGDASNAILNYWQNTEPPVCGVAHGVPNRVDRIRALGNAVVPSQAKEAFKILMGLK